MQVGDRIRIFELSDHYCKEDGRLQRPEMKDEFFGDHYGVNIASKAHKRGWLHFGIDYRGHARQVSTMVITKLK